MNPVRYLYYKGKYYDVGTKVKMKTKFDGIVATTFLGDAKYEKVYEAINAVPSEDYIIEIIEPVYAPGTEEGIEVKNSNISKYNPRQGDIQIGWLWYIIIIAIGAIFKDRWLIWIAATVIFFIWKGGNHLDKKGGKK